LAEETLTLVFGFNTLEVAVALHRIDAILSASKVGKNGFMVDGSPVRDLTEALARLEKKGRTTFNIAGQGYEFDLGRVKNNGVDFFLIDHKGEHDFLWDDWATPFLGDRFFVMAWLADSEYEFWQNAKDLLQYRSRNRPFDHLPKKSNGLPYPLEQTIIDTSRNPGRRVIRQGFHEVVGAVMWLGEPFWRLTGADREAVEHADWLQITYSTANVVRIQAAEECFTSQEGSSKNLQERLRSLLFPGIVAA